MEQNDLGTGGGGKVANYKFANFSEQMTITRMIPYDDTPPQITEGVEVMTIPYTPIFQDSTLVIKAQIMMTGDLSSFTYAGGAYSMFADSAPDALTAGVFFANYLNVGGQRVIQQMTATLEHSIVISSTTPRVFRVRCGTHANGGNGVIFNGYFGSRLFGTIPKSSMSVMEIRP